MEYSETKRIIRQAMYDEKFVVFVGAGVSKRSNIPLWSEATKEIKAKLDNTIVDDKEYLKIPQLYFNTRGEKEYNELIENIFKYEDKQPNEIHNLIIELNPCNIITTNYDDLWNVPFGIRANF